MKRTHSTSRLRSEDTSGTQYEATLPKQKQFKISSSLAKYPSGPPRRTNSVGIITQAQLIEVLSQGEVKPSVGRLEITNPEARVLSLTQKNVNPLLKRKSFETLRLSESLLQKLGLNVYASNQIKSKEPIYRKKINSSNTAFVNVWRSSRPSTHNIQLCTSLNCRNPTKAIHKDSSAEKKLIQKESKTAYEGGSESQREAKTSLSTGASQKRCDTHPWRNLIFSPNVETEVFKQHLLSVYNGLVYSIKNLRQPNERLMQAKIVNLVSHEAGQSI